MTARQLKAFSEVLDKNVRKKEKIFQIEGIHLVKEMIKNDQEPLWVVLTEDFANAQPDLLKKIKRRFPDRTFQATSHELRKLTDTEHPQGIVAAVQQRGTSVEAIVEANGPIVLLDEISDPGNLGTVIRTADWFGVSGLILSQNCVEFYNPKVVRASMGSVFRVRSAVASLTEVAAQCRKSGRMIVGSKAGAGRKKIGPGKIALIMGNESRGLSPEIEKQCDTLVGIPGSSPVESLNLAVACGILLYELTGGRS